MTKCWLPIRDQVLVQVLEIFQDAQGRTVNRLLTAVPVAQDVAPLNVPYCRQGPPNNCMLSRILWVSDLTSLT